MLVVVKVIVKWTSLIPVLVESNCTADTSLILPVVCASQRMRYMLAETDKRKISSKTIGCFMVEMHVFVRTSWL